jgi:hypothetical protein
MKLEELMAVPTLLYKCATRIKKSKNISKIQGAKTKFSRSVHGCTGLQKIIIETVSKKLNIYSVNGNVDNYKEKLLTAFVRMENDRLPKGCVNT